MQRVLVMGSSGSGKSRFALRLSDITGIPMVSLDALFWKPGWTPSDAAEFEARATEAAHQPRWIMDGNYTSSGAGELRRKRRWKASGTARGPEDALVIRDPDGRAAFERQDYVAIEITRLERPRIGI